MGYSKAEYLEKIASIITNTDLYLTVDNDGSYVQLGKAPIKVNISDRDFYQSKTFDRALDIVGLAKSLGYDAEEFKLFIQRMMLYHECGHIKFTPSSVKYPVNDDVMLFCGNFVEDARVESRMATLYPPAGIRIELMNRILLANINIADLKVEKDDKMGMAKLCSVLAGYYFYGLTTVEPKSPVIQKMIDIMKLMWNSPKMTGKHMVQYAKELYDMIPGIVPEQLENDLGSMTDDGDGEGDYMKNGISNSQMKEAIKNELKSEIMREMKDIKRTIKAYGMDVGERDERDEQFEKYIDKGMIHQMSQQLCRILGAKPSKHDMIDYDGHSLDVESFLEYKNNPYDESKMYLKMGKRVNPDFHISVCIDRSGSMSGTKMELAKKSVINLCLACDKVGIKTEIIQFDGVAEMVKFYDQNIRESEIHNVSARGGTIISTAVDKAMTNFRNVDTDSKKAIIVVSDGWDGSGQMSAQLVARDKSVGVYMIGIQSDMNGFMQEFAKHGGRMRAFKNLQEMKKMGGVMTNFATDFVRRSNIG